mmetsp:Transcript_14292/g.37005  ORF Transcript_14292/g.37005 Transcript_14292/m.37005 type:complete len:228 (-) Transcript_14292:402-1085(-)
MMSRRMVVALSLNFLASSSSPTARDAFSSCRISSSSLRVARMMDPSKMSVMSQIFWNDAPWDQWKMTSIRLALKLSTYGSTSTSMPSSLLISAMKRAVRCRSPSGPERSFVSWICSLVLSTGTRQLTSATSWCLSKLLNTPLNMSSVVSSSSAVSISHAARPLSSTVPCSSTCCRRRSTACRRRASCLNDVSWLSRSSLRSVSARARRLAFRWNASSMSAPSFPWLW